MKGVASARLNDQAGQIRAVGLPWKGEGEGGTLKEFDMMKENCLGVSL
jgi:hypothetical protein